MNIYENFDNAEVYLEMAKEKLSRQDFDGSLAMLAEAYSHTRALLEQVYKLHALKTEVEIPASDNSGGP